ncbi:MAG: hypothetical protein WC003_11490 [Terrimicrobiaceae bacterium]
MRKQTKQTTGRKTGKKPTQERGGTLRKESTAAPALVGISGRPAPGTAPFPSRIPSTEVVATLAASLLKGEDMTGAVERALDLLELADELISWRQYDKKNTKSLPPAPPVVPSFTYEKGAKEITGQKRLDRALEYLQDFILKNELTDEESPALKTEAQRKMALSNWISKHEKLGFTSGLVGYLKKRYQDFKINR